MGLIITILEIGFIQTIRFPRTERQFAGPLAHGRVRCRGINSLIFLSFPIVKNLALNIGGVQLTGCRRPKKGPVYPKVDTQFTPQATGGGWWFKRFLGPY